MDGEQINFICITEKLILFLAHLETLYLIILTFDALAYVYAGTVESQSEVWWFYPSKNSSTNDSYIVYNYKENIWFYGSLNRSAWLDSNLRQFPQAVGDNFVYNHEVGNDADGSAMTAFITSSDF